MMPSSIYDYEISRFNLRLRLLEIFGGDILPLLHISKIHHYTCPITIFQGDFVQTNPTLYAGTWGVNMGASMGDSITLYYTYSPAYPRE
jgi:hypothetical protein